MPKRGRKLRDMLTRGEIDEREVEIEVRAMPMGVEIMAPPGMEEMQQQLQSVLSGLGGSRTRTRRVKVREALKIMVEEEAAKLINEEELKARALANAEQNGIVFIDEIDKITRRQETLGADVSREGVQRDLLPLVEGCTVNTKYGSLKTDHVLFIASGAFHMSKPSDLIPELQGRFPIRVELDSLKVEDFVRILTEPDASLTAQYRALLAHRAGGAGVHARWRAAHRRDRLPGQRAHREHRRAPPAHRDGAAAGDRSPTMPTSAARRRASRSMRVRRSAPGDSRQGRGPEPLHLVAIRFVEQQLQLAEQLLPILLDEQHVGSGGADHEHAFAAGVRRSTVLSHSLPRFPQHVTAADPVI